MFGQLVRPHPSSFMIKRIVMMPLLPGKEALFLDIFDQAKTEIRGQRGCLGVELLKSEGDEGISIWTISLWDSPDDLEAYRSSSLFRKTWASVKPLFRAKAMAWTLTAIDLLP
jgi:heme-degrading monooxygenase HmoA